MYKYEKLEIPGISVVPVFRCPESCSGLIVSLLHSLRVDRIYVWWWLQSDIVVVTVGHDNSDRPGIVGCE